MVEALYRIRTHGEYRRRSSKPERKGRLTESDVACHSARFRIELMTENGHVIRPGRGSLESVDYISSAYLYRSVWKLALLANYSLPYVFYPPCRRIGKKPSVFTPRFTNRKSETVRELSTNSFPVVVYGM